MNDPFPFPSPLTVTLLQDLSAIGAQADRRGWVPGTSGNFSLRTGPMLWISRSGMAKGAMKVRDFYACNPLDGTPFHAFCRSSAEAAVHAAIYRLTDARAVVHAHAPCTVALCSQQAVVDGVHFAEHEMLKVFGYPSAAHTAILKVAPNPLPEALTAFCQEEIANYLHHEMQTIAFAAHGVYCWGRDPADAWARLEALECLCQTAR